MTFGSSANDDPRARAVRLAEHPDVRSEIERARDACTALRWHNALRRRAPQAAAEARVRGARGSALLEGADLPVDETRDLMRGAVEWGGHPDPVVRTVRAAVQVTAEAEHVRSYLQRSPLQALARLHVAAGTPLLPGDEVGRPRGVGDGVAELVEVEGAAAGREVPARLAGIAHLLRLGPEAPALVVAALVHAEVATARPFTGANALVARALERALLQQSGVDPTGVAVPEVGHHRRGPAGYVAALGAYTSGDPDGLVYWVNHCAAAVTEGAAEGGRVADAVLAGRLGPADTA